MHDVKKDVLEQLLHAERLQEMHKFKIKLNLTFPVVCRELRQHLHYPSHNTKPLLLPPHAAEHNMFHYTTGLKNTRCSDKAAISTPTLEKNQPCYDCNFCHCVVAGLGLSQCWHTWKIHLELDVKHHFELKLRSLLCVVCASTAGVGKQWFIATGGLFMNRPVC